MEIIYFVVNMTPFILACYIAALIVVRPPRRVLLSSMLGGLVLGLVHFLFDVAAYYAHWWHYTISKITPKQGVPFNIDPVVFVEVMSRIPLPLYISSIFVLGSIVYLAIWRLWRGRYHWVAMLLLIGAPLFNIARDLYGSATGTTYKMWDSPLAVPMMIVMWLVAFYAGYFVFNKLAPARSQVDEPAPTDEEAQVKPSPSQG